MTIGGPPVREEAPKPVEKKLTREQRRFMQRIETEARRVHEQLAGRFMEYLVTCDNPHSPEVLEKASQISAQWKVFCRRKNLVPAVFNALENYCDGLIKEYQEIKAEKATPETLNQ
jgi:5'(3')-deoxyribonucleotidase